MWQTVLLLIIGAGALWKGATYVVDGSIRLARFFNVSMLLIGLTIIAIGTSLPELWVGIFAALDGSPALSFGNIIGAGMMNMCVVLGIGAIVSPVKIKASTLRGEIPFVFLAIALVWLLALDGVVDRFDGILLVISYCALFTIIYIQARKEDAHGSIWQRVGTMVKKGKEGYLFRSIMLITGGIVLLIVGGKFAVSGGSALAESWGVAPLIIGITLVSVGTVLPEIITAVVSSREHVENLNVGSVIGGMVFNFLFVIGIVSIIREISVSQTLLWREFPVLIAIVLLAVSLLRSGATLRRWEGAVLIGVYVLYIVYLLIATPSIFV
ncbi:MAG: calcium/sodium antiporter [Candidatus Jacksonbacteria bacterium]|jgi:cation:H+ antiporter|nr:calcium/sodium antiporter [Candidatus Jacksonbacteria bacterium]MBT6033968.1 calcium/sodium antiporter [Candidatus Jacksonbacteria bacterium]MBT6301697.1 calcium/sodium antiporter [Candidatus Jacksonbacteria bacterium]MBT6757251.1 calcium/sodium antiporter [Candidatus Jacksonbacteria bacterium]MBT6955378.1 calcium/sodium antiporter [Candidatus Jacksonbacteria bacterium]